jgi:hypothetical protein
VVPQINVIADGLSDAVMHAERLNVADFDGEHFRAQLVERLAWAVGDADAVEVAHRNQRDGAA